MGIMQGTTIGVIKGDTRSLDYGSCLGIPYTQNPTLASSLKPRSPPTFSRASWPEG